jgi:hypothetical protein
METTTDQGNIIPMYDASKEATYEDIDFCNKPAPKPQIICAVSKDSNNKILSQFRTEFSCLDEYMHIATDMQHVFFKCQCAATSHNRH